MSVEWTLRRKYPAKDKRSGWNLSALYPIQLLQSPIEHAVWKTKAHRQRTVRIVTMHLIFKKSPQFEAF